MSDSLSRFCNGVWPLLPPQFTKVCAADGNALRNALPRLASYRVDKLLRLRQVN